jgi:beta-ketoacyl synthase
MSGSFRRVVVTGLGAVSSIGIGKEEFWSSLTAGSIGCGKINLFDTSGFEKHVGGQVYKFDAEKIMRSGNSVPLGRSAALGASAARLAADDAELKIVDSAHDPGVVAMGTTSGESFLIEQLAEKWYSSGESSISPSEIAAVPASEISRAVSSELSMCGDSITISTACSASNYAIGYGFDAIRTGAASVAVCGGADSLNRWAHAGFNRIGALAHERCRPFDVNRDGIITAEGGVALILESLERAESRGATIYAEVLGWAANCDASHPVSPDGYTIAECIRDAQENAGVSPEDVSYISAHGTGTPTNDSTEIGAIREVFGENIPPISSIKSSLGHTMGAASGFGALACCMAINTGLLPPTAATSEVDPDLQPVDIIMGEARKGKVRVAQNHGFAFGGNNAIVIFGELHE